MKHITKANNLRDLWKSYIRSFWLNHKIHIKPTKCLIFLTMTSGEVLFFEYQGGFCAQAGWGAPVHGGEGSVLSLSWHSALLRDSENAGPVGSQWTPTVTEPWHLSPRRGVRQVIRQQSVQCYHLPVCRFQLSEAREPATQSQERGRKQGGHL